MEKIGFIGLGIMGRPMAKNLLKKGNDFLIYDIDTAAVEEVTKEGGRYASLAEIGEQCDVVFTILPNEDIVKQVLFDDGGVNETIKKDAVVVDMSSVTPVDSKFCAQKLEGKGVEFLDAPVSGGEPKAIDGTLAFMVGGKQAVFDRIMPIFMQMGTSAVLVGNVGSAVMEAKAPRMIERNFAPGGKISINHKDIKNVLSTAHVLDIPAPMSAQLFEIMQSLKVRGLMNEDHSSLVKYFEQLANVEVEKGAK